jgi:putative esterase
MPDGARSFYTDMKYGDAYYSSIVCDVMRSARSLFPLSVKREKNFTAGLSMGGYGALKIALKNPDVFSGAISLSGVLNIAKSAEDVTWDRDFTLIWGEDYKNALPGSEDDLFYLTDNIKGEKPRIFISCGDCDFMLGQNRDFREHIKDAGFDFRYEEHPGNHNWMYWAEHIAVGLDFILGR